MSGAENNNNNDALYEPHQKIYPQKIAGTFRQIKWIVLSTLLGLYYIAPWIRWDRGVDSPDQALLLDMTGRRGYFFNIEIWPQEVYYLTGILILAAVGLFLVTSIAGRVWCGFTCPQTVWTDLFLWVERKIEGDRNKRMRLDNGKVTVDKILRKIVKHIVWIVISLLTGGVWIFYFNDAPTTLMQMIDGTASVLVYGFTALFAGTTYLLAGWAREQVCTYMCPWPRFQSAMFDEHSLIVTYEKWRGEPRSKAKNSENVGDCVDCNLCVNVCPTGVDIRKGTQMGCIGCALCVDACNTIMDKLNRPRGLVTYDSVANQQARAAGLPTKKQIIRPRTVTYALFVIAVAAFMVYGLMNRPQTEINIQRDRAPLFVTLSDGSIRNGYTLKVLNMVRETHTFELGVEDLEGALISVVGLEKDGAESVTLSVKPDSVGTFRVFIRVPKGTLEERSTDIEFSITELQSGRSMDQHTVFIGPK